MKGISILRIMAIDSKAYKLVPIIDTIMRSKEDNMLKLFFNSPTKEWHFEEILKQANITRSKGAGWLKVFLRQGLVKKVKEKGKMPHYIGNYESPAFKAQKKVYALQQLEKSGFLAHLISLEKAKTVIIFGSMARSDWYDASDIDIFIYGDDAELEMGKYELKLNREIQLFTAKNKKALNKLGPGLLKNIAAGYFVKGSLDFLEVKING